MQGYHNKPEATKAVMTPDGGFRTGDRGRIDEDGFLFITGRLKEQFKLENGKYVFPAAIEEDIRLNHYIENAMIHGEGRAYNVCIVVPDFVALEKWAVKKDGGVFDQFAGATITPRGVVKAVKGGLEFFEKNRAQLLDGSAPIHETSGRAPEGEHHE